MYGERRGGGGGGFIYIIGVRSSGIIGCAVLTEATVDDMFWT
jgi:hypothetical protein